MRFCLNKVNARSPKASVRLLRSEARLTGQAGNVKAYAASTRLNAPEKANCPAFSCIPPKSTTHMEQMNPMVPNTRIGGKAFTVSSPAPSNAE